MCFAPWNCSFWILNSENLCAGNLPLFAMLFPAPFPASWIFFVISSTSCHYLTDPSRAATTKIHPSLSPQMTAPYGHCFLLCYWLPQNSHTLAVPVRWIFASRGQRRIAFSGKPASRFCESLYGMFLSLVTPDMEDFFLLTIAASHTLSCVLLWVSS